jgi:hypothetical protein
VRYMYMEEYVWKGGVGVESVVCRRVYEVVLS